MEACEVKTLRTQNVVDKHLTTSQMGVLIFPQPFVVPLRILMLFGGGMIAVLGSESIGYGGAGPLGCITAAFVSCYFWSKQGWEVEDVSYHLSLVTHFM
jgi:hypothetical protein